VTQQATLPQWPCGHACWRPSPASHQPYGWYVLSHVNTMTSPFVKVSLYSVLFNGRCILFRWSCTQKKTVWQAALKIADFERLLLSADVSYTMSIAYRYIPGNRGNVCRHITKWLRMAARGANLRLALKLLCKHASLVLTACTLLITGSSHDTFRGVRLHVICDTPRVSHRCFVLTPLRGEVW